VSTCSVLPNAPDVPFFAAAGGSGRNDGNRVFDQAALNPGSRVYFVNAFLAASSITSATFAGSCRIDKWHVAGVVVTAPIFFAAAFFIAGGSILFFVEMTGP
jgi:hypothetical protein